MRGVWCHDSSLVHHHPPSLFFLLLWLLLVSTYVRRFETRARARLFLKNRKSKHRRSMGQRNQWSTLVAISLLIVATFVQSKDAVVSDVSNEEIYQIDYRGPETHSALPPPEVSGADPKPKHQMKHDAHKTRKTRHG